MVIYPLRGGSEWLYVVPWGLRRLLAWIKKTYNNPPIYITENGISDRRNDVDDKQRVDYLRRYINETLKGINSRQRSCVPVCVHTQSMVLKPCKV